MREVTDPSDFRKGMISRRLEKVGKVILVLSGKGGVGKSVVSAALAEILAQEGFRVGLLDADVYGPSSALLFGLRAFPREQESGLLPPTSAGVKLMSVDLFASGRPVPLTGDATVQVLTEMLALTDWGEIDYLIVDMPPATGDVMLLLTSLDRTRSGALIVCTPDKLSASVARRVLTLLRAERFRVIGVLGNMGKDSDLSARHRTPHIASLATTYGVPIIGVLPFTAEVPAAVEGSDVINLVRSQFGRQLKECLSGYIIRAPGRSHQSLGIRLAK